MGRGVENEDEAEIGNEVKVTLELHTFVELFVKQSGTNIDHTKRLST